MSTTTLKRQTVHSQAVLSAVQASYIPVPGSTVPSGSYKTAIIYQNVSVLTGTGTPTWKCKLQGSMDNSTWDDITSGGFTDKTSTGTQRIAALDISGYQFVQLVYEATGSTVTALTADTWIQLAEI